MKTQIYNNPAFSIFPSAWNA